MAAIKVRLKRLEVAAKAKAKTANPAADVLEQWLDGCAAFVAAHVPQDFQAAIFQQMTDSYHTHSESLASWQYWPFARWAPPMPPDYQFPLALCAFLADPPHDYFCGHACERCGLHVPICTFWDGKTGPPHNTRPFAACPACGGATSSAAIWQTGPKDD